MPALLTDALLVSATDKLARIYGEIAYFVTPSVDLTVTSGTILQVAGNQLLAITVEDSNSYEVERDLNAAFYTVATGLNAAEMMANLYSTSLTALNTHYASESDESGFAEYLLATNNPTGSLDTYAVLVDAWFQDFWTYVQGTALDPESVMTKPIHPSTRGSEYTDAQAMGSYNVATTTYTDGYEVDAAYGACKLTVEVVTDFSGGGAAPTITITGTDAEGATITWTATVTGGSNPTSAIATTITPAITTAAARLTVAVGSTTGIVAGSVLTVNSGLVDEEVIIVESIAAGPTITAVFTKNHSAGAALTGKRTFVTTPSTVTSRCRDVTNIAVGITGHTAGVVRVTGLPERVAI